MKPITFLFFITALISWRKGIPVMKILFFFNFLFFSCIDKEETPPIPNCTCDDYNITDYFSDEEGKIIFPISGWKTYQIVAKKPIAGVRPDFVVCSDSTFLSQITIKQIKDGSVIKFSGGILGGMAKRDCTGIAAEAPSAVIRVKTID